MIRTLATAAWCAALLVLILTVIGCEVDKRARTQNEPETSSAAIPPKQTNTPVGDVKAELENFNDDATFNVELYAPAGNSIRKWQGVSSYERGLKSKCVRFILAGKIHRIYGTMVVEATEKVEVTDRKAEYDITLYGADGKAIREWHAFDVAAEWEVERCNFTEAETGRVFAVYGTIVIQQR